MRPDREALWGAFFRLPVRHRGRAMSLLDALDRIAVAIEAGSAVDEAVKMVARATGPSPATLYRARSKVAGVPRHDWLPVLAPRYMGRCGCRAGISPAAWRMFVELRSGPSGQPLKAAWRGVAEAAAREGWAWPSYGTVRSRCIAGTLAGVPIEGLLS